MTFQQTPLRRFDVVGTAIWAGAWGAVIAAPVALGSGVGYLIWLIVGQPEGWLRLALGWPLAVLAGAGTFVALRAGWSRGGWIRDLIALVVFSAIVELAVGLIWLGAGAPVAYAPLIYWLFIPWLGWGMTVAIKRGWAGKVFRELLSLLADLYTGRHYPARRKSPYRDFMIASLILAVLGIFFLWIGLAKGFSWLWGVIWSLIELISWPWLWSAIWWLFSEFLWGVALVLGGYLFRPLDFPEWANGVIGLGIMVILTFAIYQQIVFPWLAKLHPLSGDLRRMRSAGELRIPTPRYVPILMGAFLLPVLVISFVLLLPRTALAVRRQRKGGGGESRPSILSRLFPEISLLLLLWPGTGWEVDLRGQVIYNDRVLVVGESRPLAVKDVSGFGITDVPYTFAEILGAVRVVAKSPAGAIEGWTSCWPVLVINAEGDQLRGPRAAVAKLNHWLRLAKGPPKVD